MRLSSSATCSMPRSGSSTRSTKRPRERWSASFSACMRTSTATATSCSYLRNQRTFFSSEDNRELDLILIDYDDLSRSRAQWRNRYEVTEEFSVHNGRYGTREDIVFLINGIPVLVIECKNANKDEAIALGIDQIRRYHLETPEVMVPEMLFTATEAIGFSYGVTWNTVRRNIFRLEARGGGPARSESEELLLGTDGVALRQGLYSLCGEGRGTSQVDPRASIRPRRWTAWWTAALDAKRTRGLVWHTQGSGKTYTMIKAAELLFKAPKADKPTILLMIDRNELEDQMLKNLAAVGLNNVAHANSIAELNRLLKQDYRGSDRDHDP